MIKRSILLWIILFSVTVCAQVQPESEASRLARFYKYYIVQNDRLPVNHPVSRDTLRKYCAASFLKKIRNDKELDYDPIVHANDFDSSFVKTLKVINLDASANKYGVTYWYDYEKKYDTIIVFVAKEQ